MRPGIWFLIVWTAWVISWVVAAAWTAPTRKRVPFRDAWIYRVPVTAGAILMFHRTQAEFGAGRLWHVGYTGAYALLGLTVLGILLAWWARIYLGNLWSGSVTRKEGHTVVDSGPYALVRHPIYTGLLLATLATDIAKGTALAIAAFALIAGGLWIKARLEERFLSTELDAGAYAAYRRRVPMLIPFMPVMG